MLARSDLFARLGHARQLLADVSGPKMSVEEIAREVGMSPFHFIRRFDAVFGVTPHQFRIEARIDRAKRLLALGGHAVTDVCFDVGFESLGSFSDLFTRRVGASPSAYRRRVRVLLHDPGALPPALAPGCLSLLGALPAWAFRSFREADATAVCQTQPATDWRRRKTRCGSSSQASWSMTRTRP